MSAFSLSRERSCDEDLFVEFAAGDAFGDLGFLDARATGALFACVIAGVGLA
jgi:hypothetical protein